MATTDSPTSPTTRVALYARVSTSNSQNPEMQLDELRSYCQRRGWLVVGEYTDAGISGARERRPQLDKLVAACRRRLVDCVVVYRYDRLARSLRHLVNFLEDCRSWGVDFISLHEGVDTSTPNGRLVFGIFASIAEFERELIRDRVRSGLAAARRRGARLGRPRVYADGSKIADLRSRGWSWARIARELGVGVGTVVRAVQALRSPAGAVPRAQGQPQVLAASDTLCAGSTAHFTPEADRPETKLQAVG